MAESHLKARINPEINAKSATNAPGLPDLCVEIPKNARIYSAFQAIRAIAKSEDKPAENVRFSTKKCVKFRLFIGVNVVFGFITSDLQFVVSEERTEPALLQQGKALIRQLKPLLRELYK